MTSYPWNNAKKDASTLSADWADAILALAEREKGRKPDPRPLAKLLRKGGAPDEALEYIAELIDPIFKELDYRLVPRATGFRKKESLKKIKVKHKSFLIAAAMRARLIADKPKTVEEAAMEVGELPWVKYSPRYVITLWGNVAEGNPQFWGKKKRRVLNKTGKK